jgi:hypothetical protein
MSTEHGGLEFFGSGRTTLGSLAQSARQRDINAARNMLIGNGCTYLFLFGFVLLSISDNAANLNAQTLRLIQIVYGFWMGEGMLLLLLGLVMKSHPVPGSILGLTLNLAESAILMVGLAGQNIAAAVPLLVIFLAILSFKGVLHFALIKAVRSALAYQRELNAAIHQADPIT